MTGKEMLLVLGGAAIVGGGAGAAVVTLGTRAATAPPAVDAGDVMVAARISELEKELRATRASLDEARVTVGTLDRRIGELGAWNAEEWRDAGSTGSGSGRTIDAEGSARPDGGVTEWKEVAERLGHLAAEEGRAAWVLKADGSGAEGQRLRLALENGTQAVVHQFTRGLGLRALPEEERWKKAQEELGLGAGQVEALREAAAERDRALEEAMVTEKHTTGEDGSEVVVRRLDGTRAAEANRVYRDRVDQNLTEEQRKSWKDRGYDHAFGRTPVLGGSAVMTMAIRTETTHSTAADVVEEEDSQEEAGSGE